MRVTIYLTDEQVEFLKVYCQEQGVSRAAAIRQGIDLLLQRRRIGRRGAMRSGRPSAHGKANRRMAWSTNFKFAQSGTATFEALNDVIMV